MTDQNREPSAEEGTTHDVPDANLDTGAAPDASSTPASSPGDNGDTAETPKSTLDVIRDVTRKDKADQAPAATPSADKQEGDVAPDAEGDKSEAKETLPPFHTHPRWIEKQREVKDLRAKVAELEQPARNFTVISTFMERERISTNTVVEALQVAALIQNEPEKAIVQLRAVLADLEDELGERLPEDLALEVEDGLITEARAKELAKARAATKRATAETQAVTNEVATREKVEATKTAVNVMATTVASWEAAEKAKDPAYAKKQPFILKAVQASVAQARAGGKTIFTAEEVTAILETAKKDVNAALKAVLPPKPEVKPLRQNGHRTPTQRGGSGTGGEKISTLDIVRNRGARTE